ncbi:hypothetical protein V6N11_035510 [Hibiscus sabdariffa]|uniref:Gag-asp_proteas domain-containing protein n=1 Tax=Hibiscus sabdariffa TaxID=183260 RepID=A0ABR2R0U7_9ROSI
MHEQASYVGNFNRNLNNPYSDTYNPWWRQHPNFAWGNQRGANVSSSSRQQNLIAPPGFQANMPSHSETKALHVRPHGNLPSNTEVTKSNGKEQCSALTLRSGKEINKEDKFGGKSVEDPTPSHVQKELEILDDSPIEEDKGEKVDNEKTKEQHENAAASAVSQPTRDEVHPPPPFPQQAIDQVPSYAKFLKDIVTKRRKVESYETIVVASEYCAARIDLPIKKKHPGSFIIPCSIGNNFMRNALCDLGSSVNLMPKALFKKIGIGIERLTTVILQLADRSHVRPEGKV